MKRSLLRLLVCPDCRVDLRLTDARAEGPEIIEGLLVCDACRRAYPVSRGIPRFVPTATYAESFGYQWQRFRTVQLDSHGGRGESARAFDQTTGWSEQDCRGKLALDAGVGAGRFAEVAAARGAEVVGVDLTTAVDAAYLNVGRHPSVHLVQADIFALPFRDGAFDLVYSIGVLHHTPDPRAAFARIAAMVRKGGQCAVYVYGAEGIWYRSSDVLRRATTRVPRRLMVGLAWAAVPLHHLYRLPVVGRLGRLLLPISPHPDWRWRWLDTFDWYTPAYQWKLRYPEVLRWFRAEGFADVEVFDEPIRLRGVKAADTMTVRGHAAPWWHPVSPLARVSPDASVTAAGSRAIRLADYPAAFWCFMAFTFFVLVAPQNAYPVLQSLSVALTTGWAALLLFGIQALARGDLGSRLAGRDIRLLALFATLAFASIPFSWWPGGSWDLFWGQLAKSIAVYLLAANLLIAPRRFRQHLWLVVLCGIVIATIALLSFVGGATAEGYRIAGALAGLTANPNDLALTLNLLLPFGLALCADRSIAGRIVAAVFIAIALSAVVLSFSRAGFLTLATMVVLWGFRLARRWGAAPAVGLLALLLAASFLLPAGYGDRMVSIVEHEKDELTSATTRLENMGRALKVALENPLLGVGLGQNILALNEKGGFWSIVHSAYLQIAADLGVPALVVFLLLFGRMIGHMRAIQAGPTPGADGRQVARFAGATEVSLWAYAVAVLFHPVAYHFYFFYIAGFAAALHGCHQRLLPPAATG